MTTVLSKPAVLESWTTSGGVRVLFVARPSLPIVDLNIDFEAGTCYDPPGKAGVAEMVASLLLTGQKRYGDLPAMREEEAEHAFDEIGAKVAADAQADRIAIGMRSLSQPVLLDRALALLTAMLLAPSWAARPFERERERLLAAAEEQRLDPEQLCALTLTQALYGKHAFGIAADPDSIAAITRADVADFHRRYLVRSRTLITLVGDLSRAEAEAIATRLCSALPEAEPSEALEPVRPLRKAERWIDHPASQAHIAIGALVPGAADPDYFPLMLANRMFSWYLNDAVRDKLGLAYEVSSALFSSRLGEHRIGLKTRKDQAVLALDAVRQTLARFIASARDDLAEFERTRSELVEGRPLALDSNAKLIRQVADIAFDRLPLDYFSTWSQHVEDVTLERAIAAFSRWIDPARQVVVVVGGDAPSHG